MANSMHLSRRSMVAGMALAAASTLSGCSAGDGSGRGPQIGGPFALTRTDGSQFTDQDLRGKPFAIFFGFTRCPDVCPTTLSQIARLRPCLGEKADRFNVVFVSIDTGHDTPEQLGRYLELFPMPVIGLTGREYQIASAARNYRVMYRREPVSGGDYTMSHTAAVFLMDAQGRFRDVITYGATDEQALTKLQALVGPAS